MIKIYGFSNVLLTQKMGKKSRIFFRKIVNPRNILDIVFLGAGYFPTLGLVGQGLGDFVNWYNVLLDIGYLGSWILSDIFQLWVWLAGGLGVAVEWQAAPNAPPDNKPSPTFEMRMLVMMMMKRVMMQMRMMG